MQNRFGAGFGGRHSIPSNGLNVYFGKGKSNRPKLTPTEGQGRIKESEYFRAGYSHDDYQVDLIKKCKI